MSNECWEWVGCRTAQGYGLKYNPESKKLELVHRLSYRASKGEIPSQMVVMHTCDNPGCFNPDHLKLGSYGDNLQDAYDKGRFKNQHMKKTHCLRGHEFPPEKSGRQRRCKECRKIYG